MCRHPGFQNTSSRGGDDGGETGSATLWLLVATSALTPLLVLLTTFVIVSAAQQHLRQVAQVAALAGAESLQIPGAGCARAAATVERAVGSWRTRMTDCHVDGAGASLLLTLISVPPTELPTLFKRLLPASISASARAGWVA